MEQFLQNHLSSRKRLRRKHLFMDWNPGVNRFDVRIHWYGNGSVWLLMVQVNDFYGLESDCGPAKKRIMRDLNMTDFGEWNPSEDEKSNRLLLCGIWF